VQIALKASTRNSRAPADPGACTRTQAQKEAELLEMRREASRRQLEAAKKEREAADARQSARAQQAAAEKQQQARAYKERIERLKATWKDDKAASKARARYFSAPPWQTKA
jgi:2-hydroxychromene-2-carboxylate isomerase